MSKPECVLELRRLNYCYAPSEAYRGRFPLKAFCHNNEKVVAKLVPVEVRFATDGSDELTDFTSTVYCPLPGGDYFTDICRVEPQLIRNSSGDPIRHHFVFSVVDRQYYREHRKGVLPRPLDEMETRIDLIVHLESGWVDVCISGPLERVGDNIGNRVICEIVFGLKD